jgi:hypothetical protein
MIIFKDMKHTIKLFLICAVAGISMLVACKDDNGSDGSSLVLDQTELDVLFGGGQTLISVNTGLAWNASVDAEWVTVSPASGSGSGMVTVTIAGREQGERRTAQIIFTAGGITRTVDIRQRGYTPSDYYATGDVLRLHRHTVGEGIAIVIIGDGFDREDCKHGGLYEEQCWKLNNVFLAMPVIRDFKEYFDVSARVDVSRERGARNCVSDPANCPYNAYGVGHPDLDWDKIRNNATLTAGKGDRSIIFMGNGLIGGAAYGDLAVYSANDPEKVYWMIHEFAGHILGQFPDLYVSSYASADAGLQGSELRRFIDDNHAAGGLLMLDWRTDPNTVYWKDFIGREGYPEVGVTVKAGNYSIAWGNVITCEPFERSAMDDRNYTYNVMERYQLWRNIQARAGTGKSTIAEFIEYDAVNVAIGHPIMPDWQDYDWETDERVWAGD